MTIQAAAFTPLGDDGKVGLSHVAHEKQDVDVAGLPAETTMALFGLKRQETCEVDE